MKYACTQTQTYVALLKEGVLNEGQCQLFKDKKLTMYTMTLVNSADRLLIDTYVILLI